MATSVIDPDNDTGTDYLSLAAWVTGEAGDQSGAACIANCRSTSGSYDTGGQVTLQDNPFTNFTGYVTIQPLSDTYRHDGTLDGNTSNFVLQNSAVSLINCENSGNVVIEGIALDATRVSGAIALRCKNTSAQGDTWLLGNLAVGEVATGIYLRNDADHFVINNIVISEDANMLVGITMRSGGGDQCCYNNTFIGSGTAGTGIYDGDGSGGSNWRVYNNIVQDCDTDYDCSIIDSSGGNISQDATSPQTGLRSITLTFADSSNDDYHLASGDTDAIGAGTDLDGDSYYAVTEDIDQDSRDTTAPDIGADEYVSAGGTSVDVTDTGGGSDSVSLTAALSVAETGSGSDALVIAVALPVGDTGSGSDTLLPSALALVSEAAAGADSATIAVSAAILDSASGSEVATISVSLSVAETGAGSDLVNVATEAIKLVTDTATGTDTVAPIVTLSVADAGYGTESPSIDVSLSVADTGSGADVLDIITSVLIAVADAGSGAEALGINVSVEVPDAAAGADALAISTLVAVVEAAGGTDIVSKTEPGTGVRSIEFTLSGKSVVFTLAAKTITFTLQ